MGAAAVGAALFSSMIPVPDIEPQVLRPNILVIVLDDTGVEKLSLYNPAVPTPPTPQLSSIAASGVRFTHAYANPLCSPTRATIMTGRYSFRTGMGTNTIQLPLSEVTIAELLRDGFPGQPHQYKRAAFGKWHLTVNGDFTHYIDQGFEKFSGPHQNVSDHFIWNLIDANSTGFVSTPIGSPTGPFDESTFTASVVRQNATAWINSVNQPFFAYVCFNPPHAPFQVPPLTLVSAATANTISTTINPLTGLPCVPGDKLGGTPLAPLAYDWLIEAVDTEIGRLVNNIPSSKKLNTTILIMGDNGTPMPVIQVPPFQASHAKGSVYEQGTLVPLIAKGRNVSSAGLTCTRMINSVDIWRTVAALTGAQLPAGVTIDGISFKNLLANPNAAGNRTQAFAQLYGPPIPYVPDPNNPPAGVTSHSRAMNDGQFKYVRLGTATPTEQAFDLVNDPLELTDLFPGIAPPFDATELQILGLKTSMITLSGF